MLYSPEWPLDKAQNFLGQVFAADAAGNGFKEDLAGERLHLRHDPVEFALVAAKSFLRVKDFQPGQPPFAVVISGDALGQMFGRDRGFAECDAQRIHFGIVADFHGLKAIRIDRYHNYFSRFIYKHRANRFGPINFPVPILSETEIFPAIQSPQLGCAPRASADRFFHFRHGETARSGITQGVFGKSDLFHFSLGGVPQIRLFPISHAA
jgi:hypothetical protein